MVCYVQSFAHRHKTTLLFSSALTSLTKPPILLLWLNNKSDKLFANTCTISIDDYVCLQLAVLHPQVVKRNHETLAPPLNSLDISSPFKYLIS